MLAFVKDTAGISRSMGRVADALAKYAPPTVQITQDRSRADLIVMHVVGFPETAQESQCILARGKSYAVCMYCLKTTQRQQPREWLDVWRPAKAVWSYYDLGEVDLPTFYHSPLGVDEIFTEPFAEGPRDIGVLSSGYVSGHGAEAIEEVAIAADRVGMRVMHLGPPYIVGMSRPQGNWTSIHGVPDDDLANVYRRCQWVSGLRYVEGFELPVIEGLCCGARPIVFDRSDMRQWYDGHAVFVPECGGQELVDRLVDIFAAGPEPVSAAERAVIQQKFAWAPIIHQFWERVQ